MPANPDPAALIDLEPLLAQPIHSLQAMALAAGLQIPPLADRDEILLSLLAPRLAGDGLARTAGILELLPDGFGFLRSPAQDLLPCAVDAYVSPAQIRRFHLQPGHRVEGLLRAPARSERFFALVEVLALQGRPVATAGHGLRFAAHPAVLPQTPLPLADTAPRWLRAAGLLAPWCRGQRVLLHTPAGLDAATLLGSVAVGLAGGHASTAQPLRLQLCLLDASPERIEPLRRQLAPHGIELQAASFDQASARQLQLAELAVARAQREVETGADVVLLFGCFGALAHHHQLAGPQSGRWLCPGLDSQSMHAALRLFATARQLEHGGSLTVIATTPAMDTAVARTLATTLQRHANSQWRLVAPGQPDQPATQPTAAFPAEPQVSIAGSATRPEDLALPAAALARLQALRAQLLALDDEAAAYELLLAAADRLGASPAPPEPPGPPGSPAPR